MENSIKKTEISTLNIALRIIFCLQCVIYPIIIYFHLLGWLGDKNIIGVNSFFLSILFILFMQVLFFHFLPKSNGKMLLMLFSPWLFLLIKFIVARDFLWQEYILDAAFLYTSTIMIGFLLVLFYVSLMAILNKKYEFIFVALIEFIFFTLPFIYIFYYYLKIHLGDSGWQDWLAYAFYLGGSVSAVVVYGKIMLQGSIAKDLMKNFGQSNLEIK
jgi:hypothetical protein